MIDTLKAIAQMFYQGFNIGEAKVDLVAKNKDDSVLIELKAITTTLGPKEEAQLRKYMECSNIPAGILVNFPQAGRKGCNDQPEIVIVEKEV